MKITIELDENCQETEIIIRTAQLDTQTAQIQEALSQLKQAPLIFYQGSSEFFIPLKELLFFETQGKQIFAHTKDKAYEVKLKLYELEERLPLYFCRIAKSTIVNVRQIYSLEKSFSGTSTIAFYHTYKTVHVSRHYYRLLKAKIHELR